MLVFHAPERSGWPGIVRRIADSTRLAATLLDKVLVHRIASEWCFLTRTFPRDWAGGSSVEGLACFESLVLARGHHLATGYRLVMEADDWSGDVATLRDV